ncbi:MAG: hypothetical protein R3360_00750, partial [Alphaproteobacteria bacterium]|nr:hypothetical protein [Alphaproteobacteria bacterium]
MRRLAGFAVLCAIALGVFVGLPTGQKADYERSASIDDLLDPTRMGRFLCGHQGQERGQFFRPALMTALGNSAKAAPAAPEAPLEVPSLQGATDDPPLWPGLGEMNHPVTTASEQAQAYFNQGMALAFGFNHWEAGRSFRKARQIDPLCAMCYWGEAL